MNILVFGWYNHGNIGDESFKISFKKVWNIHNFTFVDDITPEISDMNFDLCIIGGGDVICKSNLIKCSKLNCKKIAISVTITNNSLTTELKILDYIYVRDELSLNNLKKIGFNNCELLPDISLVLSGNNVNGLKLINESFKTNMSDRYEKVYAITINAHLLGNYNSESKIKTKFFSFVDEISSFIDNTNASFLFIPFSTRFPSDDRISNSYTNSQCKYYNKNSVIFDTLSVQDTLDVISACDFNITTRFHGLIFSQCVDTPCITISFHDKFEGYLKTINQDYINYYDFSLKKINEFLVNNDIYSDKKGIYKQQTLIDKYRAIHFIR